MILCRLTMGIKSEYKTEVVPCGGDLKRPVVACATLIPPRAHHRNMNASLFTEAL
jgi:hypothetical protein